MTDPREKIECRTHGTAYATFVCEHLIGASGVRWYSAEPIEDDKWPSAWCDQCQSAFAVEGEWNEKSESAANLKAKLLCHHCYENTKSRCQVVRI